MDKNSAKNNLLKLMQFTLTMFAFFFVSLFVNVNKADAGSFGNEVYVIDYKNGTVDFAASFTSKNYVDVVDYGEDFSIYAAICNVSVSKSSCGAKTVRIFTTEGTGIPGVSDMYELTLNYDTENVKGVISYTYYDSDKSTGPSEPAYLIKKYYTPSIYSIKANSTKYSGTPMYNIYIKYVDNRTKEYADGYFTYVKHRLCVDGVCEYYYFKDALVKGDNLDIEVVRDVEECFTIKAGKNINLDMNGHKLSCNDESKSTIQNNGKLTVVNSSNNIAYIVGMGPNVFANSNNAELILNSSNLRIGSAGIPESCIHNLGKLEINKATIYCGTSIYNAGEAYINSGIIDGESNGVINKGYIKFDGAIVTSIKGNAIVNKENGKVDILGDSYIVTKAINKAGYAINNDGVINVDINEYGVITSENAKGTAVYNSGTFNLKNGTVYASCVGIYNDSVNRDSVLNIEQGIVEVIGNCSTSENGSKVRSVAIWTDASGEYKSLITINGGSIRAYGDAKKSVYYGLVAFKASVVIDNTQITSREYGLYLRTNCEVKVGKDARVYADETGAYIGSSSGTLTAYDLTIDGGVNDIYEYSQPNVTEDEEAAIFESVEINQESKIEGIASNVTNGIISNDSSNDINVMSVIALVGGMLAFIALMAVVFGKSKKNI